MAAREGVEPSTFRLTAECSNQLSYQAKVYRHGR
jgi:hypothetical protein